MDPDLQVRDPSGNDIPGAACGNSCSFRLDLTLDQDPAIGTGTYTLFVRDQGKDEGGTYSLGIERIPPTFTPPCILYGSPDRINFTATDLDFFTFEAVADTEIELTVSSFNDNLDPVLEIRGPTGAPLLGPNGDPVTGVCFNRCNVVLPLIPPETGTYQVLVSDAGMDEGGIPLSWTSPDPSTSRRNVPEASPRSPTTTRSARMQARHSSPACCFSTSITNPTSSVSTRYRRRPRRAVEPPAPRCARGRRSAIEGSGRSSQMTRRPT